MRVFGIIPVFLFLIILTYGGVLFVDANRQEVSIHFFRQTTGPVALGFVVLTSILLGMIFTGGLCSIEILALHFKNRRLKKRVSDLLRKTRDDAGANRLGTDRREAIS